MSHGYLGAPARVILAVLSVLAFLAFVATHTVDGKMLNAGYYKGVLVHADAYNRAYRDLPKDPELQDEIESFTGGVPLIGDELDLIGGITALAPPELLQEAVELSIDQIIEYMKNNRRLEVFLDITPFVSGAGIFDLAGLDFGGIPGLDEIGGVSDIGELGDLIGGGSGSPEVDALPTARAGSYEEFRDELVTMIEQAEEDGSLPEAVPVFRVPNNRKEEVIRILTTDAGVHGVVADDVEEAIDDDEVEEAVKASLAELQRKQAPPTESEEALSAGEFVREVEGPDGETRYILAPPDDVQRDLDEAFSIVHWVSWTAGWGRPLSLVILAVCLGLLLWRGAPTTSGRLAWTGAPLLAGGLIAFFAWLIARPLSYDHVIDITLGPEPDVPLSLQEIWKDVLAQAYTDLTPSIWVPAIVAIAAGLVLVIGAFMFRAPRPRSLGPDETPTVQL